MKTRLALFATLSFIVAQLISGCAGIAAALDVTQFAAGTYSGSYRSQGGEQSGTATITVSRKDRFSERGTTTR